MNRAETPYTDITIECRDCGGPFTWTAGEQSFYASGTLQASAV
jgi:hypothetical protein